MLMLKLHPNMPQPCGPVQHLHVAPVFGAVFFLWTVDAGDTQLSLTINLHCKSCVANSSPIVLIGCSCRPTLRQAEYRAPSGGSSASVRVWIAGTMSISGAVDVYAGQWC